VVPAEEVPEMEQEALAETANVVLNSCLAMMANMLERPLTMSLPEVLRGEGASFFELGADAGPRAVVLFLYINFAIDEHNIRGYIAMLMDLPSIDALRALVRDFIAKVVGEE
jgi:chemotaxis protein CheC